MPELNGHEAPVLDIVRFACRFGDPVDAAEVKKRAWPIGGAAVASTLASLVAKGLLTKPSRGFYLPVPREEGASHGD